MDNFVVLSVFLHKKSHGMDGVCVSTSFDKPAMVWGDVDDLA